MTIKQFKPMLAATLDPDQASKLSFPLLASPKLDGIRCVVRNGRALTRSLKPVPNLIIRETLEALAPKGLEGCDGELMIDDVSFHTITSTVMSQKEKPHPEWYYAVFDHTDHTGRMPFSARFASAEYIVNTLDNHRVKSVPHEWIDCEEQLLGKEQDFLACGFEGVMLRDPEGFYKYGRSTVREGGLLKLKRFSDDEARVVGVVELQHNHNEAFEGELGQTKRSTSKDGKVAGGTLGALVVENEQFGQFELGTGFTEAQRAELWSLWQGGPLCGKIVKFKYFAIGVLNKPRHPVFLGFRAAEDMS